MHCPDITIYSDCWRLSTSRAAELGRKKDTKVLIDGRQWALENFRFKVGDIVEATAVFYARSLNADHSGEMLAPDGEFDTSELIGRPSNPYFPHVEMYTRDLLADRPASDTETLVRVDGARWPVRSIGIRIGLNGYLKLAMSFGIASINLRSRTGKAERTLTDYAFFDPNYPETEGTV